MDISMAICKWIRSDWFLPLSSQALNCCMNCKVLNFDMLHATWGIFENHYWYIVCSPNFTSKAPCNSTHFHLKLINVIGQKCNISNLRIKSSFHSQGYLNVLMMFYLQIKQAKQPTDFFYKGYLITEYNNNNNYDNNNNNNNNLHF